MLCDLLKRSEHGGSWDKPPHSVALPTRRGQVPPVQEVVLVEHGHQLGHGVWSYAGVGLGFLDAGEAVDDAAQPDVGVHAVLRNKIRKVFHGSLVFVPRPYWS